MPAMQLKAVQSLKLPVVLVARGDGHADGAQFGLQRRHQRIPGRSGQLLRLLLLLLGAQPAKLDAGPDGSQEAVVTVRRWLGGLDDRRGRDLAGQSRRRRRRGRWGGESWGRRWWSRGGEEANRERRRRRRRRGFWDVE
jgi:hypothetical protein